MVDASGYTNGLSTLSYIPPKGVSSNDFSMDLRVNHMGSGRGVGTLSTSQYLWGLPISKIMKNKKSGYLMEDHMVPRTMEVWEAQKPSHI